MNRAVRGVEQDPQPLSLRTAIPRLEQGPEHEAKEVVTSGTFLGAFLCLG